MNPLRLAGECETPQPRVPEMSMPSPCFEPKSVRSICHLFVVVVVAVVAASNIISHLKCIILSACPNIEDHAANQSSARER
jgi:hypothetical protein